MDLKVLYRQMLIALMSSVLCTPVLAGPSTEASADAASALDSIVVIGKQVKPESTGLAGSLDVIGRDELANERVDDTMELFSKIPGVYFSRFNQGLINTDIAIRGFAGDGETPHAKLLIDGIPGNLHNGYSELDQLFPLSIESIQVYKGTSDARVGLFNIAGNYRVQTRTDVDVVELDASLGSFAAKELQGYAGIKTGELTQNYFAGYREADGYRDGSNLQKSVLHGRWAYDFGAQTTLAVIARASHYDSDAPGYLSKAQSRSAPRSQASYAILDGGDKDVNGISVHLDHAISDTLDWSVKAYVQDYQRERWVRFSEAGSLQNRFDDQDHRGLISTLMWQLSDLWRLEAGADAERQDVLEQRFGTVGFARVRNVANVLRNRQFEFDSSGVFLRADYAVEDRFGFNVGVRFDELDGDYVQFSATGVPTSRRIYNFGGIVQPKANVFFRVAEALTVFANYGRSFQHPLAADAYTSGDRGARDVSRNNGYELGAKWRAAERTEVRLSFWRQNAEDEFVLVDGNAQNVGKTERDGIDLSANWQLSETLSAWANYTTVDSEIVLPASARAALIGNALRSIPDHTGSLGLSFQPNTAWSLRLHLDRQGDYYVNEANLGGKFGAYTLLHGNIDHYTSIANVPTKFSLQLNNITDRFYEYVFDFSENGTDTIHSPGDGRSISLSASVSF